MRSIASALLPGLFLVPALALAQGKMWEDPTVKHNPGFEDAPAWQESEAPLPAYPAAANLVRFEVSPTARNEHFIDTASLAAGEDGVVRYTLVMRSPSGSESVSHEGLRCDSGERKVYAYGRANGQWARNSRSAWANFAARDANNPQRVLFFHYFCTLNSKRDVPTLLHILKTGGVYVQ